LHITGQRRGVDTFVCFGYACLWPEERAIDQCARGFRVGGGQTVRKKTHEHNGRVCPPRGHVVANEEFLHLASVVLRAEVGEGLQTLSSQRLAA